MKNSKYHFLSFLIVSSGYLLFFVSGYQVSKEQSYTAPPDTVIIERRVTDTIFIKKYVDPVIIIGEESISLDSLIRLVNMTSKKLYQRELEIANIKNRHNAYLLEVDSVLKKAQKIYVSEVKGRDSILSKAIYYERIVNAAVEFGSIKITKDSIWYYRSVPKGFIQDTSLKKKAKRRPKS